MKRLFSAMVTAAALSAAALFAAAAPAQMPAAAIDGYWMNPHGTVAVRTGDCQGRLCGWVAWASPKALYDAKDSGVDHLVGVQLLSDYEPDGPDRWEGSVYVPDMGHHFSSSITRLNADQLKIQGCLIGGFFCKSQVWQRIAQVPHA
jgi:uncharacterized protein (DUF2147 family)